MVLVGFVWTDVVFGMLWTSLIVLILVLGYKKLLAYLSKGDLKKEDYCQLFNLEISPASGELPFYFTAEEVKNYSIWILDENMKEIMEVVNKECKVGGNIVRFQSNVLENGTYFYCLKTNNQKTCKKMIVLNQP